jgi:hypothetical protein
MANDDEITSEVTSLTKMAKRIGLKGTAITNYVSEHMAKLGYEAQTHVTYTRKSGGGRTRSGGGFLDGLFGGDGGSDEDD